MTHQRPLRAPRRPRRRYLEPDYRQAGRVQRLVTVVFGTAALAAAFPVAKTIRPDLPGWGNLGVAFTTVKRVCRRVELRVWMRIGVMPRSRLPGSNHRGHRVIWPSLNKHVWAPGIAFMPYPGSFDTIPVGKTDATVAAGDHAPHHNQLAAAVNAIETELGLNPRGSYADVKTRLGRMVWVYNVKDYLAVGDGVTNDTTAINNAATAAAGAGVLFFPPGNYVYNGTGITGTKPIVVGSGRGVTTITLGASSYLLARSAAMSSLVLRDIKTVGGLGAIHGTFTGDDVSGTYVVEDNEFTAYTGACISHNSSDMPYWKIQRNIFLGANYTSTMGIALSGLTDGCTIADNEFLANRIHVKLRQGGNNSYIRNNDFIRFGATGGFPRVDVWVVPQASALNAGQGMMIDGCKFGNENLDAADYRILYADEDTAAGTDNGSYFPKLSADSTGFIVGHHVSRCLIYSGAAVPPLVYSTTPNVRGCQYGPLTTNGFNEFIKFRTAPTADRSNADNIFGPIFGSDLATESTLAPQVSSNGIGVGGVVDPNNVLGTRHTEISSFPGSGDPVDYVQLLATGIRVATLGGGATVTNVADVYGGIDAAEFTIPTSGVVLNGLTIANITPGIPAWIEFDVKQGSSSPLASVWAYLRYTSNGAFHWRRYVTVPSSGWVRYRFRWTPREKTTFIDLTFANPTGASGLVQLGRVYVYHAREPLNVGGVSQFPAGGKMLGGTGVPAAGLGNNGDFYFRSDTPGTANQRLYVKSAGAWVGIV